MLRIQKQVIKQINKKKEDISFFKKKIILFKLKRTVKKINKIKNDIFELNFISNSFPYLIDRMDDIKKWEANTEYSKENCESKWVKNFVNHETCILLEYERMKNLYEKALSLILRELCLIIRKDNPEEITIEAENSLWSIDNYLLNRDGTLSPKPEWRTLGLDGYEGVNIGLERLIYEELK